MIDIKAIIMDVDGVLTNGTIIFDEYGKEYKTFNVKDGTAIHIAINIGFKIAWISGRYSEVTTKRAEELKIHTLYQNTNKKIESYNKVKETFDLEDKNIAYIGDDFVDIPPMIASGLSMAPNDAANEVKRVADYISSKNGGKGCVRDCIEYILKEMNIFNSVIEHFFFF